MYKKILTTFLIIFFVFVVFNPNDVFGIGTVSQAWKRYENGEADLIFRTFTTPYSDTVQDYYNTTKSSIVDNGEWTYTYGGKSYTSYWVDTSNVGFNEPSTNTFSTIGFAFHTEPMGSYPEVANGTTNSIGYNLPTNPLGKWMSSIKEAYTNSTAHYTTPGIAKNYNDVVFYELMRASGTLDTRKAGTNIFMKSYVQDKKTELQYCIVNIGGSNVYVADNIIYAKDFADLYKAAKENGLTDSLYVSDIVSSKTRHTDGGLEICRTVADFFNQHKKGYAYGWSSRTRGTADGSKAMGAVANLYDNKIQLPNESKRTVLVRHINVGLNTSISTSIINSSSRIATDKLYFWAENPDEPINGSTTSTTYVGYQEYYENAIAVNRSVEKSANDNTDTYKCLGYNIAVSTDKATAEAAINTKIQNGQYTSGTTAYAPAKDISSANDYVIIDFYYTEYDKDVYVNHLYITETGEVKELNKQNIIPNNTATMVRGSTTSTVHRTNEDTYISEVYSKKLGHNIRTTISSDIVNQIANGKSVKYMGYETFAQKTNNSTVAGTQRQDLKESRTATLTSDVVQVNYYYTKVVESIEIEPEKKIEGQVFVDAADNYSNIDNSASSTEQANNLNMSTECNDSEQNTIITSIPSGTNAKVGITGIPRYMVGAITTEYVSPALESSRHSRTLNLSFKMGTQSKKVTFENVTFRAGYYKVTDMVVYKLSNMTIYDADRGYSGTVGQSLFDWKNGNLSLTPNKMDLDVVLTGVNGRKIENNKESIDNIGNYLDISYENKRGKVSSGSTFVYLTEEQLAEVDANADGAVTTADKTFADNKLNEYKSILNTKKQAQDTAQKAYDNAVSARKKLENDLSSYITTRDTLKKQYEEKEAQKTEKLGSIQTIQNDIAKLENTTIPNLENQIKELEDILAAKNAAKDSSYTTFEQAEAEKNRLNGIYLDAVEERTNLEAKANCTDYVDEDIYIYLEKEEKEALEQCKLDKALYQANLDSKSVENAKEEYESYLQNEYSQAKNNWETANSEYDTAVTNLANKQKELNTEKNTNLPKLRTSLDMANKDYENFIKEQYSPIKAAYENYRDNIVPEAEKALEQAKKVEKEKSDLLNEAKDATDKAQTNYNDYDKYRNNLYANYESYKKLYDEFMSLSVDSPKQTAEVLGLKLNVFVQNMTVKINGQVLTNAKDNTAQKQYDVATLLETKEEPKIYTERPVISKDVYSNIDSTLMEIKDYTNSNYVDYTKLNGVSALAGKAEYEPKVVIGSKADSEFKEVKDTIFYSNQNNDDEIHIFKLSKNKITKTYKLNTKATTTEEKYKETKPINIYTPITISAKLESDTNQIINQTENEDLIDSIIQINTPFTIKLNNDVKPSRYDTNDTNRFSGGYYIKFDFDVHKVKLNGKIYKNGARIPAGTWIGIIEDRGLEKETYIVAQAYSPEGDTLDVVTEENCSYTVRAVAYNTPTSILNKSKKYSTLTSMMSQTSELKDLINNICYNPTYFDEETYDAIIVNRAYDFKVTDVKDVNWKSVFRSTSSSNTNTHKQVAYYSGVTKWNTKSEKSNDIVNRTSAEIGRNPQRILPIGPYKNTTTTYVKSPKMGYRFSFDVKVTGAYYTKEKVDGKVELKPKDNKKVLINTKFYYVSKDGKTYIPEYDGTNKGIYLFYKTGEGKYVRIDANGGDYTLRFTPNDGYRYITDNNLSTLSKTSVVLGNLRNLELKHNMATVSNNGGIITYYGEYKLPNSTIAVKVNEDGSYDINSPLKDGYIGVVFDIVVYAGTANLAGVTQDVMLSYAKNTKPNTHNTSQWDYEGFLGYTNVGQKVSDKNMIKLKLEKGTWSISDKVYNEIKGTVMLYDLDESAATDYE